MREYEDKEVIRFETEMVSISCDNCGVFHKGMDSDITAIDIDFSYGSRYDGIKETIDLCDSCCTEMLEQYKNGK